MKQRLPQQVGLLSIANNDCLQRCVASNGHTLLCISPKLPTLIEVANIISRKRSRGNGNSLTLNYTLLLDGAPGPNLTDPSHALFMRANPVFVEIDVNDQEYVILSGNNITIMVSLILLVYVHKFIIVQTLQGGVYACMHLLALYSNSCAGRRQSKYC